MSSKYQESLGKYLVSSTKVAGKNLLVLGKYNVYFLVPLSFCFVNKAFGSRLQLAFIYRLTFVNLNIRQFCMQTKLLICVCMRS